MKIQQGANENLDWAFNWVRLLEDGETISSAVWTSPGLTQGTDDIDGTLSSCFFTGGTAGTSYQVICQITTSAARVFERSFKLKIVANP